MKYGVVVFEDDGTVDQIITHGLEGTRESVLDNMAELYPTSEGYERHGDSWVWVGLVGRNMPGYSIHMVLPMHIVNAITE